MAEPKMLKVIAINESPPPTEQAEQSKLRELRRPIKVGLVQANVSFDDENKHQYYLPLSVGYMQAHAQKHLKNPKDFQFLTPVYKPENKNNAIALAERLSEAQILAVSAYTWNFRFSLFLAEEIKRRNPSCIIVFGGPHVPGVIQRHRPGGDDFFPERVEEFHRKYPFIDIACHGEGENVFVSLLENIEYDWRNVPSVSFIKNDKLVITPKAERIKDLDIIPSPYLEGIFESLMDSADHKWLVMWETNRGCPFSCSWCDWGSQTAAKITKFGLERLYKELEWIAQHEIEFVFSADANFGLFDRDADIARYAGEMKKRYGYPHKLSVQNTKNREENSFKVQEILFDAGLNNGVVMALQSVNVDTLKAIHRHNISQESYRRIQQKFKKKGVSSMSELILAQPLETYDSFADGVQQIIENDQHDRIQFNNLSLLPNAELGDVEEQRKYGFETVEIPVANIHGTLNKAEGDIEETQELVIATSTCSREDWVRTRAFAWMVGFLYFNKVVQIPTLIMYEHFGVRYRELFETFSEDTLGPKFPLINEVREFFRNKARAIQNGDYEFCHSSEYLNISWPPEEYMLIKLYAEDKLDAFYQEVQEAFKHILSTKNIANNTRIIEDAVRLNRSLLKLPFQYKDLEIKTDYNIWEFYRSVLLGERVPLIEMPTVNYIDRTGESWNSFQDWCRRVIWWGNKRGAYLYGNKSVSHDLSGHY